MLKTLILILTVLGSAALLQAQYQSTQAQSDSGRMGNNTSSATTVEGCLQNASGSYTLTDSSGTTYQLSGDTSMLSKHVGHKVRITGNTSNSSAASSGGTSQGSAPTLTVDKMKHISGHCSNPMGK